MVILKYFSACAYLPNNRTPIGGVIPIAAIFGYGSVTVFTLPVGYRPAYTKTFPNVMPNSSISILTTGEVVLQNTGTGSIPASIYLDSVSFYAGE